MNNINILIFRVSTDSLYLEYYIEIPKPFYLVTVELRAINFTNGRQELAYDLSNSFSQATGILEGRISLEELNIPISGIFILSLQAYRADRDCVISNNAICSDVNLVYNSIIKDIVASCTTSCTPELNDAAIRNYLILYGHNMALWQRDLSTAELYYLILSRGFTSCSGATSNYLQDTSKCGCGHD